MIMSQYYLTRAEVSELKEAGLKLPTTESYNLGELLDNVLPHYINMKDKNLFLTVMYDVSGCTVHYCTEYGNELYHSEGAKSTLEAVKKMTLWCLLNGFIKPQK